MTINSTNNNDTITIIVHIILHSIVSSSLRNSKAVARSRVGMRQHVRYGSLFLHVVSDIPGKTQLVNHSI